MNSTFGDLLPTPDPRGFIPYSRLPTSGIYSEVREFILDLGGFIPKVREFIPDLLVYLFSTLDLRGFELILTQNRLAKMNVFASELKIG